MKKILSLLLCLILAFSLCLSMASCGPEEDPTPDPDPNPDQGETPDDGGEENPPAPTTFTVTFDTQGGSEVASQTVETGAKIDKPTNPTRDGFKFSGWYTGTEADATEWNFVTDKVTENVTLYARWTEIVVEIVYHTVSFETDGGSAVADVQVVKGEALVKPQDPTKDGYTFLGWYTSADDDAVMWDFSIAIRTDITLYARWSQNTDTQLPIDPTFRQ